MFHIGLAGVRAHPRRLVGTFLAVFLGVSFLTGTMVLGATLGASIDGFLTRANAGTDVVVRNAASVSDSPAAQRGAIDGAILDRVRGVDGVAAAVPVIDGFGQIVGHDGRAVQANGPKGAGSWIGDAAQNPYHVVEGHAPRSSGEVVVDRATARTGHLHPGDATTLLTPTPVRVTVVGIVKFGDADTYGGSSYVGTTFADASREIAPGPGRITRIVVRAQPGISQDELARRVGAVIPAGTQAVSGARVTAENIDSVESSFVDAFRAFLMVFAGIALLVAAFSIHNTFSILTAQRTRESALLRAVGASRGQVVRMVTAEAAAVGAVATGLALPGGLGLSALLKRAFAGLGFDLPAQGLVFTGTTVAVAVPVGIGVTLLSAVLPALRASRTPPVAALREVAAESGTPSRRRVVSGALLCAVGLAVSVVSVGGGASLGMAGVGALVLMVGVVVLGPVVARPVATALGAPAALRGVAGDHARRNATRNPRRTAGAAAALMIGVAVVGLFTVFASSLRASTVDGVGKAFRGDFGLNASRFGNGGMSPGIVTELRARPEVSAATAFGHGTVRLAGASTPVTVVDPGGLAGLVRFDEVDGSVAGLAGPRIAVAEKVADDRGWHVGTRLPIRYGDGASGTVTVGAVYRSNPLAGDYVLTQQAWQPHAPQSLATDVYVALAKGVDQARGRRAIAAAAAPFGQPTIRDRGELADAAARNVTQLLGVVYVMLALAIVIALMGIANTLSLAVHERTREIGLLRAVGATRRQVRSVLRWESVITALFGTLGGLAVGVFLGWTLVSASDTTAFAVSPGPLAVIVLGGAVAGLLAGLRPARRAARLPLLEAVAAE